MIDAFVWNDISDLEKWRQWVVQDHPVHQIGAFSDGFWVWLNCCCTAPWAWFSFGSTTILAASDGAISQSWNSTTTLFWWLEDLFTFPAMVRNLTVFCFLFSQSNNQLFYLTTALLSYRSFGCCRHIYRKLFHTVSALVFLEPAHINLNYFCWKNVQVFHILAVPAVVMGFITVLDSRNLSIPPKVNFYTLHSWMGLTTMGLFAIQVARMVIELQ